MQFVKINDTLFVNMALVSEVEIEEETATLYSADAAMELGIFHDADTTVLADWLDLNSEKRDSQVRCAQCDALGAPGFTYEQSVKRSRDLLGFRYDSHFDGYLCGLCVSEKAIEHTEQAEP